MRKAIAGFVAGVVVGGAGIAGAATANNPVPLWMNKPCAHEYSVNCFWNGGDNGKGAKFYARYMAKQAITCYTYVGRNKPADRCYEGKGA